MKAKKYKKPSASTIFVTISILVIIGFYGPLVYQVSKKDPEPKYAIGDTVEINLGPLYTNCAKNTFISGGELHADGWMYEVGCVNCPWSENGTVCLNMWIKESTIVQVIRSTQSQESYEIDAD